jgi:hypothetical protein
MLGFGLMECTNRNVENSIAHNFVFTNTCIMSPWIQWIIVVPLTFSCPITLLIVLNMFKIKL